MSKVIDIINRSLRILGSLSTGDIVSGNEATEAFAALNSMLGQWNNEKLLVYCDSNSTHSLTAGTGTYTIGTGGTINTARPIKIDFAFVRYSSTDDYPLEIIDNARYQEIFQKSIETTYPKYLYYNPSYPLGYIYLWPVPSESCTLGLTKRSVLSAFTSLQQTVALPDGYEEALVWNLAYKLSPEYGIANVGQIFDQAAETKTSISRTNTKPFYLSCDGALLRPTGFNINTGSYN